MDEAESHATHAGPHRKSVCNSACAVFHQVSEETGTPYPNRSPIPLPIPKRPTLVMLLVLRYISDTRYRVPKRHSYSEKLARNSK